MTRRSSFFTSVLGFSLAFALGCEAEQYGGPLDSGQVWVADAGTPVTLDASSSAPGESVDTAIGDDTVASSRWLPDGDIETELRDVRSGRLLGKAWLSVFDGKWSYTFLSESSGGRGEVFTTTYPANASIDLEEINRRFAELWRASASPDSLAGVDGYVDYAPGCHLLKVPFSSPNDPRNHCMQNCCAIFDSWEYTYLCKQVPTIPPLTYPTWSSLTGLPISPCAVGLGLKASCIANCGLLPPPEHYGECFSGEHQCFDDRCQKSWPQSKLYCATNCYSDPSPCDIKPAGSTEFCSSDDGAEHSCQDGALRQGYWAADCDTAVSSCECRDQDKWRCADDRCAAGRKGYCGAVVDAVKNPTQVAFGTDQDCDKKDLDNPCCGDAGQPCCDGVCVSKALCTNGMCVSCGKENEKPCNTPEGKKCDSWLDYRGTGNCQPCGDGAQICCVNSTQYQEPGWSDPCRDCAGGPPTANATQCVADRCVDCGEIGGPCCPENKVYYSDEDQGCGVEWISNETCNDGQACGASGTCPSCGTWGEACCPGNVNFDRGVNYCDGDLQCDSGRCTDPVKSLVFTSVAPFADCGTIEFTVRNDGSVSSGSFVVEVGSLAAGVLGSQTFSSLAPRTSTTSRLQYSQLSRCFCHSLCKTGDCGGCYPFVWVRFADNAAPDVEDKWLIGSPVCSASTCD